MVVFEKRRGGQEWWKLRNRGLGLEVACEIVAVVRDTTEIVGGWFKRSCCDVKQYGMLARAASDVKWCDLGAK